MLASKFLVDVATQSYTLNHKPRRSWQVLNNPNTASVPGSFSIHFDQQVAAVFWRQKRSAR